MTGLDMAMTVRSSIAILLVACCAGLLGGASPSPGPDAPGTDKKAPRHETRRFGRWTTSDLGDYMEAFTRNRAGSSFCVICGSQCLVYVDPKAKCESGQKYPAMISTIKGALQVDLLCHHMESRHFFSTPATHEHYELLRTGGDIGFALPLANGKFKVSTFSLDGAFDAVGLAVRQADKRKAESAGLRDFEI